MKLTTILLSTALMASLAVTTTSCGDFLDQESDRVIYADKDHLDNASDTLYSVMGIVNKMQSLADRTILLGEVRGDLCDINNYTSSDLRDVALFNVNDSNKYNNPRDYYAVINNCNYFIAKVDTGLKNNRNEYIFMKEYAAVKAYRAWTYLQLVLNYGKVPFVTEPVLSETDAEKTYPMYGITDVCDYFIKDLTPLVNVETPSYGTIRNTDSKLFYFPIRILLGDLNLWAGHYKESALWYYRYLDNRTGTNSVSPTTTNGVSWSTNDSHWLMTISTYLNGITTESYGTNPEYITMIPGDSIPSEGNYSELRNLFNSTTSNNNHYSLTPSEGLKELSKSQVYCHMDKLGNITYPPKNIGNNQDGDLRLSHWYRSRNLTVNSERVDLQTIYKYDSRNVRIYRQTMVYLRMAEALNRAGYPRFAFQILKTGVNNQVMTDSIIPYYKNDSTWLRQFDFPTDKYVLRTQAGDFKENTMGLHSRGSGWTDLNAYYVYPKAEGTDSLATEITSVEDLIMNEEGLEFALEGYRYYDLLRVALRRGDPSYLANHIYERKGAANVGTMKSLIKTNLLDEKNWFLSWNGKLGYNVK